MADDLKNYLIEIRYLTEGRGWTTETIRLLDTYALAGRRASLEAKRLDAKFGDDHFWTVELHLDPKGPHGAFFQLFHGRTS